VTKGNLRLALHVDVRARTVVVQVFPMGTPPAGRQRTLHHWCEAGHIKINHHLGNVPVQIEIDQLLFKHAG
jgi:hypothetical protein